MKTPLKGTICISRYTGGPNGSGVTISLIDELSGCECVEIELTAEQLVNAITGASFQDCEFEIRSALVGKKRENKTEIIPFVVSDYKKREEEARSALVAYEADGWKGSVSDMTNHHCRTENGQRVNFTRYVNP